MDLLSLTIPLRPVEARPAESTPAWWGRAAHSLLLDVVQRRDESLAAALHDESVLRPFTSSTLMGRFQKGSLIPTETYFLRLTSLRADLTALLLEESAAGALQAGKTLELDYIPFQVLEAGTPADASPWTGGADYQELGAPFLLARQEPPRRLSLLFASPVTFKSGGRHIPLPLPELVFGSLLERWNAFAPVAFPAELKRYAAECLALSRYDLQTRPVPVKGGGLRVGAVGRAAYAALRYDRYWMGLLAALAGFARFSGVGAGTGIGLGQCRQISDLRSGPAETVD